MYLSGQSPSKILCTAGDILRERRGLDSSLRIVSPKAPPHQQAWERARPKRAEVLFSLKELKSCEIFFICWHFILESHPPILIDFVLYFLNINMVSKMRSALKGIFRGAVSHFRSFCPFFSGPSPCRWVISFVSL